MCAVNFDSVGTGILSSFGSFSESSNGPGDLLGTHGFNLLTVGLTGFTRTSDADSVLTHTALTAMRELNDVTRTFRVKLTRDFRYFTFKNVVVSLDHSRHGTRSRINADHPGNNCRDAFTVRTTHGPVKR